MTEEHRAVIRDAISSITQSAKSLRACHTSFDSRDDWGDDHEAKADYDADVALVARLNALLSASIADTAPVFRCNDCGGFDIEQVPETMKPESIADTAKPFQERVQPWMLECFGAEIAADRIERNHRFFEEATELVQANGMTRSEAHQLVDYTFDRPVGELHQEVGGVMVTLAALCLASNANMHESGETELARIWTKIEKIRAKQAAKPKHSPLPEVVIADTAGAKPLSAEHVTIRRDLLQDLIDDVSDYAVSREFKQRESQWRTQLLESARAALATPAPLSDEPVAWIDKRLLALLPKYYVDVILAGHKVSTDHVPLYAAPQAECAPREAQPVAIEKTVRALELILGSLEFEQHMYANADPRRSTIDFPRAIQIAKSAIQADKGEANGTV